MPTTGDAVVLGGSMAGLLATSALADSYDRVVMVDRDELSAAIGPEARKGVPQARHAHGLLGAGLRAMEDLLPGITDELIDAGVPSGDMGSRVRLCPNGRRLKQRDLGLIGLAASRPFLESLVRKRVRAIPNVTFRDGTDIVGLQFHGDAITGVRVQSRSVQSQESVIPSDLVVDASGRGSRLPAWLTAAGFPAPEEERLDVDLGYTSREYEMTPRDLDGDFVIIIPPTRARPRGAVASILEGGRGIVTLFGLLGDYPPRDDEGFLDFARTLSKPYIYDFLTTATPLDDFRHFRFPNSMRRQYEKLSRFPAGLVVIGDARCSFNPQYGQGMSVAAMQAVVLRDAARKGIDAPEFFRATKPVLEAPWQISTGGDLDFAGVIGERTPMITFINAYLRRLHAAAEHDAALASSFVRVANLLAPPPSLLRPDRVIRTLIGAGRRSF